MTTVIDLPPEVTTSVVTDAGVAYGRISDDRKGEAHGVNSQHLETDELAERRRITVVAKFVDNSRSAHHDLHKRDDYRAMLARISRGDIKYVLAWHPDRLHRDVAEGAQFVKLCQEHGIVVVTVAAGEFDMATPWGRKSFLDATTDAAFESEHKGDRVRLARKRQANQGAFSGGVRPYGWGAPTNRVRQVTIDTDTGKRATKDTPPERRASMDVPVLDMEKHNEVEAEWIRWMKDQLLQGVKVMHVIRTLKEKGVPTAAETDGRVITKQGKVTQHAGWNNKSIIQILTAPRVAGHATYHGKIVKENAWDAIISEDERQALIDLFSDPERKKNKGTTTPKWLGSLIVRCGKCDDGSTMVVSYRTKDHLAVYRCRRAGHCSIDANQLDLYVTNVLLGVIERDAADLVATAPGIDVKALRTERRTKVARRNKLAQLYADEVINDEQLESGTAAANARIAEIDTQLREATKKSPVADLVAAENVERAWGDLTLGQQREILRTLLDVAVSQGGTREVDERRVHITRA